MPNRIAVLGAGSWGTALAQLLATIGHQVRLWDLFTDHIKEIGATRENKRYHPHVILHRGIEIETDLGRCVEGCDFIFLVTPSHGIRPTLEHALPHTQDRAVFVCASKGLELGSLKTMSELAGEVLGDKRIADRYAVLSGPTFATEVVRGLPAAVTVAARNPKTAEAVQAAAHTDTFRIYTTDDVVGVEIAAALKNVIAIAAGAADGFGFGLNTRAGLITRGLVEILRIGVKKGAHPLTFSGLSGLGDLVLTCTGDLSRNRRVGLKLAEGKSVRTILKELGQVAEGIRTAKAAYELAQKLGVEAPIIQETYLALYGRKPPQQAIRDVLSRGPETERV